MDGWKNCNYNFVPPTLALPVNVKVWMKSSKYQYIHMTCGDIANHYALIDERENFYREKWSFFYMRVEMLAVKMKYGKAFNEYLALLVSYFSSKCNNHEK